MKNHVFHDMAKSKSYEGICPPYMSYGFDRRLQY